MAKLTYDLKAVNSIAPIICHFDSSSRVATHHHDDLDLFTFLFSIKMLLEINESCEILNKIHFDYFEKFLVNFCKYI